MSAVQTSGEWREERMYVLKSLEDLQAEQRLLSEAAKVMQLTVADKAQRDISAAHDKIRALENTGIETRVKNWIITALLSVSAAILFEFIKWYFFRPGVKP